MTSRTGPRYRLVPARPLHRDRVRLTDQQRAVVEHGAGPLLVLAGPGTGKTTTLVEAAAARVEAGLPADQLLVLTFSRRAAVDLRRRIALRLGRSVCTPRAVTFHSFCYSVVRRFGDVELYGEAVRLLTAPEQDYRVRELLAAGSATTWPPELAAAYPTRGFASEVRGALATARQQGIDADLLRAWGQQHDRPAWTSLGHFFDTYLDVLEAEQVLDYAELVHRTRVLLTDPEVRDQVRRSARVVLVDEFQDTDPSQVGLLRQLVPEGGDLIVMGDPDQSVYEFRGAQPRQILDFPDRFRTSSGRPAPVLVLSTSQRAGARLLAATRRVADRLALPRALAGPVREGLRRPVADPRLAPGVVEVLTCTDSGAQADQIADLLRRAHLRDGLGWTEMAVLVRSAGMIASLSRSLLTAGVPVEVAGDEIALGTSAAVKPLLLALDVVCHEERLDADAATQLLLSPLGGLDSVQLRRLGRALRERERTELAGAASPRSSAELVRRALADPETVAEVEAGPEVEVVTGLGRLLRRCREAVTTGATAHQALWLLWEGTAWSQRLTGALAGGPDQAGAAHRDLDALCALFEVAERSDELTGGRGVLSFLGEVAAQEIPADTARESRVRDRGVRILTAHRSKGLQWPLVVVAGVQEGVWPDPRRRGSLLETDRLAVDGVGEPTPSSVLLTAERRLFYVACTRASRRLVVTAVDGAEGEGDQPSRFLTELGVEPVPVAGGPRRPLTLTGLVAELRRAVVDPQLHPAARAAAAQRLAVLAAATDDSGRPLAPAADPERWWGVRDLTRGVPPARPGPVRLSGSQVGTLLACPRQWFLERRVQAGGRRSASASFGSVVHVLAEHGVRDGLSPAELSAQLERVWQEIPFEAVWFSASERAEADDALERLVAWTEARSGRRVLGVEVGFEVPFRTGGVEMRLTGTVDRLDQMPDGRLQIVDFKTGRSVPTSVEAAGLDQLGVYQLAAQLGAFEALAGPGAQVAGAELVYLRRNDGDRPYPKVVAQPSLTEHPYLDQPKPLPMLDDAGRRRVGEQHDHPSWVHQRLAAAAEVLSAGRFAATAGESCRYCVFSSSCPARPTGRQVV